MQFDAFISHASEDKNSFVRELAKRLEEQRILIWYDEFTLKPGSSLRRSIDLGLSKSRFGIVVLSVNFFKKKWTNWELDGLVARQNSLENELIIPIWLNITKDQLIQYSPPLADKVAIDANIGIDAVISQLLSLIKPEGSTLVIAREVLFAAGITPPLVTDDWWLDVVEYCGKEFLFHEYLSFPIPWKSWKPKDRGEHIGLHALQMLWQQEAEENHISQLSHPNEVLEFIETQPGLKNACINQPQKVAFYFPQLAIRNFGGFFESKFEDLLNAGTKYKSKHECEEEVAFRHPQLGHYDLSELACFYFTGSGGGIGPSTRQYDLVDCLIWLLSNKSLWLPTKIRNVLFKGMTEWGVWDWQENNNSISDFKSNPSTGALSEALYRTTETRPFKLTKKIERDIRTRIQHSKGILHLPQNVNELFEIFMKKEIIESWIKSKHEMQKRRDKASG